jgi:hypothetical protein
MSAVEKAQVLDRMGASSTPTPQVLREMGVPKSTYYHDGSELVHRMLSGRRWREGSRGNGEVDEWWAVRGSNPRPWD